MTREEIAVRAMESILKNDAFLQRTTSVIRNPMVDPETKLAKTCISIADAMLDQFSKSNNITVSLTLTPHAKAE